MYSVETLLFPRNKEMDDVADADIGSCNETNKAK